MKVEQFFARKQMMKQTMDATLAKSKLEGRALKPYCLRTEYITVVLLEADTPLLLQAKLLRIQHNTEKYGSPKIDGILEYMHCTNYYKGTTFKFTNTLLRDEITEMQVQDRMRNMIRSELGLKSHATIECKVMDLYKKGLIEWDTVKAQHGVACSL